MGAWGLRACRVYFYPRPPRGGRLVAQAKKLTYMSISIHVLREEDDIEYR